MNSWSSLTRNNLSDAAPLRIAGFGACMITGYPHEGAGMFEIACGLVEKRLSRPVQSTIVSLRGFPAPRAAKYLKAKVFDFNPQYIVLQFGPTDAQCLNFKFSSDEQGPSWDSRPSTAFSPLRWELISLIGYLRRTNPVTPLSSYIASIGCMVDDCRSAGITPLVLSPFVYASRYTMRIAISYTNALHERLRAGDGKLVDCVAALAKFPKSSILQHDGFHLSRLGQNVVAEAIAQAIVTDAARFQQFLGNHDLQKCRAPFHIADDNPLQPGRGEQVTLHRERRLKESLF